MGKISYEEKCALKRYVKWALYTKQLFAKFPTKMC